MKFVIFILSVFLLVGCSPAIEVNDEHAAQHAIKVIEANIIALDTKDIDEYLNTISLEAHKGTVEATEELFEMEELRFELLESMIIEELADKFVIQTKQRAFSESNEYRDHISINMHTVEKQNGDWKISASEILDIYFEE